MGESEIVRLPNGRFPKGMSGNPSGRSTRVKEERYLDATVQNCDLDTWAEIVKRAVVDALDGDTAARNWLGGYLIGLPVKKVETRVTRDEQSGTLDKDLLRIAAIFGALVGDLMPKQVEGDGAVVIEG